MHGTEINNAVAEGLARVSGHVAACRSKLISGLAEGPHAALLGEYFERGKMFRATLVFLGASAVGGDPLQVTMAAEAIELCHGASLIHDDIIDGAGERRGLRALHLRKDLSTAIVLGDYLLLRAFAALTEAKTYFDAAQVLEAIAVVSELGQECCRGQVDELDRSEAPQVDPAEYLMIVERKTASLFAAAVTIGPILMSRPPSEIEALRVYGRSLGIAYQIFDDVLDLIGDVADLGKPVGNSLEQGRPLLPLIYLQEARRGDFGRRRPEALDRKSMAGLLHQEGVFGRVRAMQDQHIAAALAAVESLPRSRDVETLRTFAAYTANWLPRASESLAGNWSLPPTESAAACSLRP